MVKNKALVKKLIALDVLVIEEISMMDAEFFEKVSDYLGIIRKSGKPFGGIQLVMLGDFCQLPPVNKNGNISFCFKSPVWEQISLTTVRLTELVRQVDDPEFQRILEEVRWGRCSEETMRTIRSWVKRPQQASSSAVKPTRLFPKNVDVDTINEHEYELLTEDEDVERRVYETKYGSQPAKSWAKSCKIPELVRLCIGAQVVVTWNLNQATGIVNGTRGVVVALNGTSVTIKDVKGRLLAIDFVTLTDNNMSVTYMPLRLAYALTIHRCQGMTLDAVIIDLGPSIFEAGQGYTALSRVRNSDSLTLVAVDAASFRCHPDVLAFYGEA
jgi:ATP-dependent DNA helicase PIF1